MMCFCTAIVQCAFYLLGKTVTDLQSILIQGIVKMGKVHLIAFFVNFLKATSKVKKQGNE